MSSEAPTTVPAGRRDRLARLGALQTRRISAGRSPAPAAVTSSASAARSGLTCCDTACVDTSAHADPCGACADACGLQQVCTGGECEGPCPGVGYFLLRWGSSIGNPGSGAGQFNLPGGVAVAPNGRAYVADYHNDPVQYFQADGAYLGERGSQGDGPGELELAISVAVSPDGPTVYVGDNAPSNRVHRFTPDGTWQGEWGETGRGAGQFNHVVGLENAPSGSPRSGMVYAAGCFDSRVQFFDPDGANRGMLGIGPGSGAGQPLQPVSIGVAPDGTVYEAESTTHRISYFTADGAHLGQWGGLDFNRTPGKFIGPSGVAVAADGTVIVAGRDNRAHLFTPAGGYLGEFGRAAAATASSSTPGMWPWPPTTRRSTSWTAPTIAARPSVAGTAGGERRGAGAAARPRRVLRGAG